MSRIVTVAALTYKRPGMLDRLLSALPDLHRPAGWSVRFLIVDNDPEGSALTVVKQHEPRFSGSLVYVVEPEPGIPAARNRALDEARRMGASHLAFLDDDEYPDATWLHRIMAHRQATDSPVIAGPCLMVDSGFRTPWRRFLARSMVARSEFMRRQYARRDAGGLPMFSTNNCLLDLAWLATHGIRFDTRLQFTGSSDTALMLAVRKKGARVSWCDAAVVYEPLVEDRVSLRYQVRRAVSHGMTQARLSRSSGLRQVPALLLHVAMGIGGAIIPVYGPASLMLGVRHAGVALGQLMALFGGRSRLYERR